MKKQITIFAAAAMLLGLATASYAATPKFSVSGKINWSAEYRLNGTQGWTNPINDSDSQVYNSGGGTSIDLRAAVAAPGIGNYEWNVRDGGNFGKSSFSGNIEGYRVTLGEVSGDFGDMIASTGGNGFKVSNDFTLGALGKVEVNYTATSIGSDNKNTIRLKGNIPSTNFKFDGGLAFAKAKNPMIAATVSGKIAGADSVIKLNYNTAQPNQNFGVSANVTKNVNKDLRVNVVATFALANVYKNDFVRQPDWEWNDDLKLQAIHSMGKYSPGKPVFWVDMKYKGNLGIKYTSAWAGMYNLSVSYSYKPLFMESISFYTSQSGSMSGKVKFAKSLKGGYNLSAGVAVNYSSTGVISNGAAVKVNKTFGNFLNTYAFAGKEMDKDFNLSTTSVQADKIKVLVGASAGLSF